MAEHEESAHSADRRQEIIEAAGRAFGESGYHGTSVKDIAAEAGVAPGTLYLYFPSKRDILVGFFDYAISTASDYIEELAKLSLDEALQAIIAERLKLLHGQRNLLKVIYAEAMFDEELAEIVQAKIGRHVPELFSGFLRTHGLQGISQDRLEFFAYSLQAMIFHRALIGPMIMGVPLGDPDKTAHDITQLLLHGMTGLAEEEHSER